MRNREGHVSEHALWRGAPLDKGFSSLLQYAFLCFGSVWIHSSMRIAQIPIPSDTRPKQRPHSTTLCFKLLPHRCVYRAWQAKSETSTLKDRLIWG